MPEFRYSAITSGQAKRSNVRVRGQLPEGPLALSSRSAADREGQQRIGYDPFAKPWRMRAPCAQRPFPLVQKSRNMTKALAFEKSEI